MLQEISQRFHLSEVQEGYEKPREKYEMGMYMEGKWYRLKVGDSIRERVEKEWDRDPVRGLDS